MAAQTLAGASRVDEAKRMAGGWHLLRAPHRQRPRPIGNDGHVGRTGQLRRPRRGGRIRPPRGAKLRNGALRAPARTNASGPTWTLPVLHSLVPRRHAMRRLAFLLVLLFSLPAFSQAKHPFTFEDMMKLKRVGEPVPSPDGKWVLFSAVDVDLAANKKTSAHLDRPAECAAKRGGGHSPAKRAHSHRRSGRRPPALGAGWKAVCVSLE